MKSKVDNVKYTFNFTDITATVATDECRLTRFDMSKCFYQWHSFIATTTTKVTFT